MEKFLEVLDEEEREKLYNAPVYVGLLGALEDGRITRHHEKDAIDLVHVRTFSSPKSLHEYYMKAEVLFEAKLKLVEEWLPNDMEAAKAMLREKLNEIKEILDKLENEEFVTDLRLSLRSFADHVSKSAGHWGKALAIFVDPFMEIDINKK